MSKRKGNDGAGSSQGQIVQIDEAQIKGHLDEMVRGTVEEMLNGLLDAEAERLVGAGRYERSADRQDTCAGHYERSSDMKVVQIKLQMPKLRRASWYLDE
ncbi:MAG TPA: transposase [Deltaproteobacteria bacterium]|nr:transposase [Deltaproteobacteria bacterium]